MPPLLHPQARAAAGAALPQTDLLCDVRDAQTMEDSAGGRATACEASRRVVVCSSWLTGAPIYGSQPNSPPVQVRCRPGVSARGEREGPMRHYVGDEPM